MLKRLQALTKAGFSYEIWWSTSLQLFCARWERPSFEERVEDRWARDGSSFVSEGKSLEVCLRRGMKIAEEALHEENT
jgi:hypothetical protein